MPQNEPGEDFALGKAIWNADAAGALREIAAQMDAGAQPPMSLGQIRAAAIRLRPDTRVKNILDAVFRGAEAPPLLNAPTPIAAPRTGCRRRLVLRESSRRAPQPTTSGQRRWQASTDRSVPR